MLTPFFVFIGSSKTYKRITDQNNLEFLSRWGSLFLEFKNNKGFISTQFYLIFFIRRILFIFCQVFLNSQLIVQGAINIGFSLAQLYFIIFFNPFKEKLSQISATVAEFCIAIVFVITYLILFDLSDNKKIIMAFELAVVLVIYTNLGIQAIIYLYQISRKIIAYSRDIKKYFNNKLRNEEAHETNDNPKKNENQIKSCKVMPFDNLETTEIYH